MRRRSVAVDVSPRRNGDTLVWLTIRKHGKGGGKGEVVAQTLSTENGASMDGDVDVEVSGGQLTVQFNTATHEISSRATAETIGTVVLERETVAPTLAGE